MWGTHEISCAILDAVKECFESPVKVFINKFRKKSLQIMLVVNNDTDR